MKPDRVIDRIRKYDNVTEINVVGCTDHYLTKNLQMHTMRAARFLLVSSLFAPLPTWAQLAAHGVAVPEPSSSSRFVSPLVRNGQGDPSASMPASVRCKELAGMIGQAIAEPDRRNIVIGSVGPDGQMSHESAEYDKRASFEAEYRHLGCHP
ncbi:hypothetical protein [Paraburkholderia megapolitana]|uniref:hypothetical protein n=1 Tax=Paraburkholderia megapolitana TaxID=420953 RepID=UPI0038B988B6